MQERRNSIANALELRVSCTNPSICIHNFYSLPLNSFEYFIPAEYVRYGERATVDKHDEYEVPVAHVPYQLYTGHVG